MKKHEAASPEKPSGLSTRGAVAAGLVVAALVVLAAVAGLWWPQIELRYHRHRFRKGDIHQQNEAFKWICRRRLRQGMTEEEVERVLGEPLAARLHQHVLLPLAGAKKPPTCAYVFRPTAAREGPERRITVYTIPDWDQMSLWFVEDRLAGFGSYLLRESEPLPE